MKGRLFILTFFISTFLLGQVAKRNIYRSVQGLSLVDSVPWHDLIGGFYISNGFCGYHFLLDSNKTFHKIDFCCTGRFSVDSGSWKITDRNTVVLISRNKTLAFDIIKFDNFYFFILSAQRQQFLKDVRVARQKLKSAKPVTLDGKTYSVDYIIAGSLLNRYYCQEIGEFTGT